MKKSIQQNLLVLIGLVLYTLLFWQEKLGLNVLIFSLFIQGSVLYLHPDSSLKKEVLLTGAGTLLTAILVVIHNSLLVKIIHILSLFSFVGFVQQHELRFIFYAFLLMMHNILRVPIAAVNRLRTQNDLTWGLKRFQYSLRISVIPILVLGLFYGIYYTANPKFADLSNLFWRQFLTFFQWDISFEKILFWFTGFFLLGGLFWEMGGETWVKRQMAKTENLFRQRKPRSAQIIRRGVIDLKKEYQSGLILVIALDILLVVVNFLDIRYVWFGAQPTTPLEWKMYVHEGTYLLIMAIILAMGVLLVLFRRNLNFFPKNEALKIAAYIWVIQNALLALSVGVRNWRYVEHCGLAYKRIGVFLFLLLVLYGLYTMYRKVDETKSFYFLLHRNAWAVYAILILSTTVNWDVLITRYNINTITENPIDVKFLINDVSDSNLFLLSDNLELLLERGNEGTGYIVGGVEEKIAHFITEQEKLSFLSWNYADWRNLQAIERE